MRIACYEIRQPKKVRRQTDQRMQNNRTLKKAADEAEKNACPWDPQVRLPAGQLPANFVAEIDSVASSNVNRSTT